GGGGGGRGGGGGPGRRGGGGPLWPGGGGGRPGNPPGGADGGPGGGARRGRPCNMSRHTLVAMRYSHERNADRPSKRSTPRHARTSVSCTASSASNDEPSIR